MADTKTILDDRQKLVAYAEYVADMRSKQKNYFKVAKAGREGKASPDEVKKALTDSKTAESNVDKLTARALNPQLI